MKKELNKDHRGFVFGKTNYVLLIIGILVIFAGFLLMIGGGSEDPNVFNPEIFSFRRITLAPIVVLAGFIIEVFAILYKPKN
ncbi:MAG: DUF3098 domain-containing protein [Bacteroidia bacterium]|jgi:hypothetical protein|nr:DUF3098 domain-containing protein [Bacteroidia bacterium]